MKCINVLSSSYVLYLSLLLDGSKVPLSAPVSQLEEGAGLNPVQ